MAMGRPFKEINWEVVEKLVECDCSGVEIASKFRITSDTFYRRFQTEYGISFQSYRGESKEAGAADLKAMLHAKALNNKAPGNTTILMFLCRCRLGMREPELLRNMAANQEQIDQTHTIMQLQHRLTELEENAEEVQNDDESETE